MNWTTRVPLFGGGGFSGDEAGDPEPIDVLIIHDTFTALGDDVSIDGWEPDVVNVPGNAWVQNGGMLGNGLGRIKSTVSNDNAAVYDVGITDNRVRVEAEIEKPSSAAKIVDLAILADSDWVIGSGGDGLFIRKDEGTNLILRRRISGSNTNIASATVSNDADVPRKYALEYDGIDIRAFFEDAEVTALTQEAFSLPAALDGNTHVGFGAFIPGSLFDELKVWDLP
jgi:hypothetical protein